MKGAPKEAPCITNYRTKTTIAIDLYTLNTGRMKR